MDLTIDLAAVVQSVLVGAILFQIKTTRELVTVVKLHEWRITKIEEKQAPNVHPCESVG